MTDQEAYRLIGERAEALSKDPHFQKVMIQTAKTDGKEAALKWLYNCAIATLFGCNRQ